MIINNFSKRWRTVPLGSVAEFKNGINYSKENFGKGIKVINVKDFQNYTLAKFDKLDEINPNDIIQPNDILLDGDILLVRSNGNRDLIGRSLYITNVKEKVTFSGFTIRVRFTSNQVLPRFYAYFFRSPIIRQTLSAYGGGTNISNLNQQILKSLPVPLPPLDEQSRIVDILSNYDKLIENNLKRVRIQEEILCNLYIQWFVKFRFPDCETTKLINSPLGAIPEGWSIVNIGNLCTLVKKSYTDEYDSQLPLLDLSRIPRKSLVIPEFGNPNEITTSRIIFDKKDILFGAIRPYFHKVVVAPCKGVTNTSVFVIRSKPIVPMSILFSIFYSDETVAWANQHSGGMKMPVIRWDVLSKKETLLPPLPLLKAFDEIVSPLLTLALVTTDRNINLSITRDLLLPRLIYGELDVSDLDIKTGDNE